VECRGDLRLEQRKFFAAPAKKDVQWHLGGSGS
jgi:hypothetical protein